MQFSRAFLLIRFSARTWIAKTPKHLLNVRTITVLFLFMIERSVLITISVIIVTKIC